MAHTWTAGEDITAAKLNDTGLTDYAIGAVSIIPVANTPTSTTWVYGKTLTATVRVQCTATSTVPGSDVIEVSQSSAGTTSCLIYLYRDNTTSTSVHCLAIGGSA